MRIFMLNYDSRIPRNRLANILLNLFGTKTILKDPILAVTMFMNSNRSRIVKNFLRIGKRKQNEPTVKRKVVTGIERVGAPFSSQSNDPRRRNWEHFFEYN